MSAPVLPSVTQRESPCVLTPISPSVSLPHSSTMKCELSDHHVHIIQQSLTTTSVCQVADGVHWKPIGLHSLGNACYLNSVLQCLFTIDYSTSILPANTESPLINIFKRIYRKQKRV